MSAPELIAVETGCAARAVFTTRRGGVSAPPYDGANLGTATGDDPDAVRANRRALCDAVGLAAERVSMVHQIHGAEVLALDAPLRPGRFCGGLRGWPEADGLVTARPGLGIVVLAADCVPVLVWRRTGGGVGAAHAGWKGLLAGTIAAVCDALPGTGEIAAAVGPCIERDRYEVDAALAERFARRFGDAVVADRRVDLAECARLSLMEAGIDAAAVGMVDATTGDRERFFSHRAEGPRTGRQAGVVWLAEASR